MRILVDTNILLDVLHRRVPHYVAAAELWRHVEEGRLEGYVAAISYNNIFYIANKLRGFDSAMKSVSDVRRNFTMIPFDEVLLDEAFHLAKTDLEDAIQAVSARACEADYVVTRDVEDFASLNVKAVTAQEFIAMHPL